MSGCRKPASRFGSGPLHAPAQEPVSPAPVTARARMLGRRLLRAEAGIAAVEFALLLPVLVLLIVAGSAAARFAEATSRSEHALTTLGTLLSRARPSGRVATLYDYTGWTTEVAAPRPGDSFAQYIRLYQVTADGAVSLLWQYGDPAAMTGATPDLSRFKPGTGSAYVFRVYVRYRVSTLAPILSVVGYDIHRAGSFYFGVVPMSAPV